MANVWGFDDDDSFSFDAVPDHNVVVANNAEATGVAPGVAGTVLTSNGVSADPSFQTPAAVTVTPNLAVLASNGAGGVVLATTTGTGSTVVKQTSPSIITPTCTGPVVSNKDGFDAFSAVATAGNSAGYQCTDGSGKFGYFYMNGTTNATHLAAHTGGELQFDTNGATRMKITSTGTYNLGSQYLTKKYLGTDGTGLLVGASTVPTSDLSGTVSLTTQVAGVLPVANGGTGQTSFAVGAISSNGSALTAGTLAVTNGGTGVTTSTGTSSVVRADNPFINTPTFTGDVTCNASGPTDMLATLSTVNGLDTYTGTLEVINATGDFEISAPSTKYLYLKSGANNGAVCRDDGKLGLNTTQYTSMKYLNTDASAIVTGTNTVPTSDLSGTVSLTTQVSGVLPVANGGTGNTTLSTGQYLKGNGTSAITSSATIPVGDLTGTLPVSNGGTGVTTSTGTGSVVLNTSPSITTPTFAGPVISNRNGFDSFSAVATAGNSAGYQCTDGSGKFGYFYMNGTANATHLAAHTGGELQFDTNGATRMKITSTGTYNLGSQYLTKNYLGTDGTGLLVGAASVPTSDLSGTVSLTSQVSGTLPIANGGTGLTSTSQNFVFAGPTSGSGAPTFRALVAGDLPGGSTLPKVTIFTSGTGATFTPTGSPKYLLVELVGGGGGGGGSSSGLGCSGGGGGGGYILKYYTPATYTYTVGAGGAGGTSAPTNGSTGGNTTFDNGGSIITANGGAGGTGASSPSPVSGGVGGSKTGVGEFVGIDGGGGGQADGTSGTIVGTGGASQLSGRTQGKTSTGVAGLAYGGGGGGRSGTGAGAAGSAGALIVTEFY